MNYRQAMGNAYDVVTFLAYAATLGIFFGILLGLLALLLAAPAHAGEAESSLLLHRPPGEAMSAASLVSTDTVFRTDGPIQRVRLVQSFRNPSSERQEGLYVLRLPANATLARLSVSVQRGEENEERQEDEEEDEVPAVEPGSSHALLAAEEPGVVTRSISGIEPGETVVVEVEYQQVARYDRGKAVRLLVRAPLAAAIGRRRRGLNAGRDLAVPLGVEGAWTPASRQPNAEEAKAPWLWLVPVVLLYVAVAFFN
jgi:hypothetical protein